MDLTSVAKLSSEAKMIYYFLAKTYCNRVIDVISSKIKISKSKTEN